MFWEPNGPCKPRMSRFNFGDCFLIFDQTHLARPSVEMWGTCGYLSRVLMHTPPAPTELQYCIFSALFHPRRAYWIGANDRESEGNFQWTSGLPFSYKSEWSLRLVFYEHVSSLAAHTMRWWKLGRVFFPSPRAKQSIWMRIGWLSELSGPTHVWSNVGFSPDTLPIVVLIGWTIDVWINELVSVYQFEYEVCIASIVPPAVSSRLYKHFPH